MQTGSSETLIGWKSEKTTFVPICYRMVGAWLWTLFLHLLLYLAKYVKSQIIEKVSAKVQCIACNNVQLSYHYYSCY